MDTEGRVYFKKDDGATIRDAGQVAQEIIRVLSDMPISNYYKEICAELMTLTRHERRISIAKDLNRKDRKMVKKLLPQIKQKLNIQQDKEYNEMPLRKE